MIGVIGFGFVIELVVEAGFEARFVHRKFGVVRRVDRGARKRILEVDRVELIPETQLSIIVDRPQILEADRVVAVRKSCLPPSARMLSI